MDKAPVVMEVVMATRCAPILAEALFVSPLQASARPAPDEVRREVTATLRWRGAGGCAAAVAAEFGDHPDRAVARMGWALSTVQAVYGSAARRVPSAA